MNPAPSTTKPWTPRSLLAHHLPKRRSLRRLCLCLSLLGAVPAHEASAEPPPAAADAEAEEPGTPAETQPQLPLPARELKRTIHGPHADVVVAMDWRALGVRWSKNGRESVPRWGLWDELLLDRLVRHWLTLLEEQGVRSLRLLTASPIALPRLYAKPGELVPLNELLPEPPPIPQRPWEAKGPTDAPPRRSPAASPALIGMDFTGNITGALSGKTIYVSQGHGWYWSTVLGRWATQRGNTHQLVEDFVNAEAANHYLIPMLRDAGATVITARERDMQPEMVVVDDSDPKPLGAQGGYVETGSWQKGAQQGFGAKKSPYKGAVNPFALGGYRASAATKGKATATASFIPAFSKAGAYAVYVGFTAGSNRVKDAHFEIRHAGGVSHRRIDMSHHGQTWVYLGSFRFKAGVNPSEGAVLLHNDTLLPAAEKYVIADVVRFGGGRGLIVRGDGKPPAAGPTSGRPRWEECARYHAQYSGAPPTVWDPSSGDNKDDVTTRSRFAAWHHEKGEDALYFSWHSNAPSPGRGTATYVYGPNSPNGSYNFTGIKGSDKFGKLLQKIVVADIRATYDPTWKDRGLFTAWFGEINPKNNPEMPSALLEAAFHATKADADLLREPRFRHLLARSIYKAIVSYFAQRDGLTVKLLPEPPRGLRVRLIGPDTARVSWQPGQVGGIFGHAPTHYYLQRSSDGRAFDEGELVQGTSADIDLSGAGVPVFVRIIAANAGGVSLPSTTLGTVPGCGTGARALFVQDFTRMAASQMPIENLSIFALSKVQRLRQWRMNTFDYAAEHLEALAAAGVSVDTIQREALATLPPTGPGSLASYTLIDWAAGEQSTIDVVFSPAEQKALTQWLQGGKGRALLASGSEIAWAVDHKGSPSSGDWLTTWFGAGFESDDAGVYTVEPAPGSGLSIGATQFDDGQAHSYDVDYPDTLKLQGAKALLRYSGGKGVAACLWQVGGARSALLGFPIETVYPSAARISLVSTLMQRLNVKAESWSCPQTNPDQGTPDAGQTDAGHTDAGQTDAEDTNPSQTDAASQGQDAGSRPDASGDATNLDGALLHDALAPVSHLVPPDDDGCGCRASTPPTAPSAGALLLLVALLGVLLRRRQGTRSQIDTFVSGGGR